MKLNFEKVNLDVARALEEDIQTGDVTGELIPNAQYARAKVIAREELVLSGSAWFEAAFNQLDKASTIHWHAAESDVIAKNSVLCHVEARSRALLSAERTALNFLQLMCAVATKTHAFVKAVDGTHTKILDTRKTLPGLRYAQKYAVYCGGGVNHRFGLYDAYLIKENHIKACGSIKAALEQARRAHPELKLEVEVENLTELDEALSADVDVIMLDNFSLADIEQAVQLRGSSSVKFEVSGNITLNRLDELAKTGVDFISVGALTKSVKAVDLSLLVEDVWNG